MEENASRAIFLGISVFVTVITITLIVNFYSAAKESASLANNYDISNTNNKYVNDVLGKKYVKGHELRYLMNYYIDNEFVELSVYQSATDYASNTKLAVDNENYWEEEYQKILDSQVRPNYTYELNQSEVNNKLKLEAVFKY